MKLHTLQLRTLAWPVLLATTIIINVWPSRPSVAVDSYSYVHLPIVIGSRNHGESPTSTATSTQAVTSEPNATATDQSTVTPTSTLTTTPTHGATTTATATTTSIPTHTPTITATRTPTSTPTRTPTSAPTRTPTSTATATNQPSGVFVLSNHSYYVDSIDYLHVVGEVQNNSNKNIRFVQVTAAFYNANGQLVDTEFTFTLLNTLPPGDKTCFNLSLPEPTNWANYEFAPVEYWDDAAPPLDLTITNDNGDYDNTFGWYEITGQVTNNESQRVEYVSPVGTVYNQAGTVLGFALTYVDSTHLNPDQKSSFDMLFVGRDFKGVRSYRLQVDANPTNYRRWLQEQ